MPEQEREDEQDIDTDLDEGQEGAEDEDEGGEGEEWTPPTKQDWDNVQEALRKARRDARTAKRRPAGKASGEGGEPDPDKVREQAESAAEAKYRPMVVRSAARSAFNAAGLVLPDGKSDAAMSRAMRLLDLDDVEIDDDGEVSGLDEQIEEIKADFPEMFAAPQSRRARRVDAGGRSGGAARQKSSAELIAAQLTG